MTGKADFTEEEWHLVVQGPPTAGMIVLTAQKGGTFRETFSIAKSYAEARKQHGASALLDEIVSAKPELDRTRFGSPEELRRHGLQHLRDAVALLESKAPGDVEAYRQFAVGVAGNVADAHRERGNEDNASEAERAAVTEIAGALGTTTT
jgi:hypothetical protein